MENEENNGYFLVTTGHVDIDVDVDVDVDVYTYMFVYICMYVYEMRRIVGISLLPLVIQIQTYLWMQM